MALFSTAYLAPIAYFAQMSHFENATIEQMETFPKQTYRNRAIIQTANCLLPLIVPVVRTDGNHTLTSNIHITYREHWNIQHWRAIKSAYNASPYFLYYKDEIEKILMTEYERLIDLNQDLTELLLKKLKINCHLVYSDNYTKPNEEPEDFRQKFPIKGAYTPDAFPKYDQVFSTKMPFQPNLSILDLLFNLGPDSKRYLQKIDIQKV